MFYPNPCDRYAPLLKVQLKIDWNKKLSRIIPYNWS